MFMAGKSVPKIGEIRFGYVAESEAKTSVHKYIGIHPYLIVSNNIYNKNLDNARSFRLQQNEPPVTILFMLIIRLAKLKG